MPIFSIGQETYDYKQISTESGLPSSEAHYITSDGKGYLWIATDRGLSRFDGKKFTNYNTNHGLTSMYVNRIFIDPYTNTIWVRCMDGLLYYKKGDKFFPAHFNKSLAIALKDNFQFQNEIYSVQFSKNGITNLYTSAHGIYKVQGNQIIKPVYQSLCSFEYDGYAPAFFQNFEKLKNSSNKNIISFFDKKIPLATSSFFSPIGIVKLNNTQNIVYFRNRIFLIEKNKVIKQHQYDYVILNMYVEPNGELWIIPYSGAGAYKYKKDEFPNDSNGVLLYKEFSFTGMTQDFEGGYWFSSSTKGLIYQPKSIATVVETPISKKTTAIFREFLQLTMNFSSEHLTHPRFFG